MPSMTTDPFRRCKVQVVDFIVVLAVIGLADQFSVLTQVTGVQQVHQVLGAFCPLLHLPSTKSTTQRMISQQM